MSEFDARTPRYAGLTAIVTGASRGIGRAVAVRLASEGSDLVLSAFQESPALDEVAQTCERMGARVRTLDADLADPSVPSQLVGLASALGKGIDLVVNNAFWEAHGAVTEVSLEGWQRTLQVCLTGAMLLIRNSLPAMVGRKSGSIVNVASGHALASSPAFVAYESAKAGVLGLTRSVAIDFGRHGVRCNTLCPGLILSERMVQWWDTNPDKHDAMLAAIPLGRPGRPEEVAAAIAFLGSEDASFMTGATVCIDGGATASLGETASLGLLEVQRRIH